MTFDRKFEICRLLRYIWLVWPNIIFIQYQIYLSFTYWQSSFEPKTRKKKINSLEGFFRKSPFCTFYCINPGFGRPWNMLRKKILIAIFIMLQKDAFGQKKFWISCTGSKVPFWQFFIFAKMALLNPCMNFKTFFD